VSGSSPSRNPVIVVADDELDILSLVSYRLRKAGYEVLAAHDGEEALRLICDCSPDIVLLDVKMPKLTGIDVLKRVRTNEAVRDVPVILLSAGVEEEPVARGFEAGADEYVRKPFSPEELIERVQEVMART